MQVHLLLSNPRHGPRREAPTVVELLPPPRMLSSLLVRPALSSPLLRRACSPAMAAPLYARFLASPHFLPWLQEARAIAAEAGRPAARAQHPRPPPAPSEGLDLPRSPSDGAGPAGLALPALDPWQLALLQEQAVQTCRQHALEHERLRETTALDAKSPAGAQARAAWRRLQSAETHLAWLRSVQSAL